MACISSAWVDGAHTGSRAFGWPEHGPEAEQLAMLSDVGVMDQDAHRSKVLRIRRMSVQVTTVLQGILEGGRAAVQTVVQGHSTL